MPSRGPRLCARHLHPPPPRREGPCTLRWASVWLVLSCQAGDVCGRCGWRGRPWGLRLPPLGASVSSSVNWGRQGLEGRGNRLGKDGWRGVPRSCGRTGPHTAPARGGPRWHRPLAVELGRDLSSAADGFAVAVAGFPGVPGAPGRQGWLSAWGGGVAVGMAGGLSRFLRLFLRPVGSGLHRSGSWSGPGRLLVGPLSRSGCCVLPENPEDAGLHSLRRQAQGCRDSWQSQRAVSCVGTHRPPLPGTGVPAAPLPRGLSRGAPPP